MTRYYVDKSNPDSGSYVIAGNPTDGYRWEWNETAKGVEYADRGDFYRSVAEAYRDAANDWETHGSPEDNPRLASWLRAAATRAEKETK